MRLSKNELAVFYIYFFIDWQWFTHFREIFQHLCLSKYAKSKRKRQCFEDTGMHDSSREPRPLFFGKSALVSYFFMRENVAACLGLFAKSDKILELKIIKFGKVFFDLRISLG